MQSAALEADRRSIVCVDLDGTLVAGDLMWESLVLLLRTAPLSILMVPLWAMRGRAYLKRQIARHAVPDPAALLYRDEVLEFLRHRKSEGHRLVLATGADEIHARAVANHLGLFSDVLASDGRQNLSGQTKATRLTERFGAQRFDYLGNDWVDVPSWTAAGRAIVVAAPHRLRRFVAGRMQIESALAARPSVWRSVLRALRPHQWVKNALLFVPLIAAHRIFDVKALAVTTVTLVAFCLCASGIYVANDLLDIQSDRQHPRKRRRPFAAGELSVPFGIVMSTGLVGLSFLLALTGTTVAVAGTLLLYVAVTSAYSFWIKREPVADVFVLATLYVLRIYTGSVASGVPLSNWFLGFALFFFLSLAFVKRYTEVAANGATPGRGYSAQDALWMHSIGTSAGSMAVVVLALYVNAPEVSVLYGQPRALLFLCPLLLFWLSRLWLRAGRGLVDDDPVLETLRDPVSYVVGAVSAAILFVAL